MDFHDYPADLGDKLWEQFSHLMEGEDKEMWGRFKGTDRKAIEAIVRRGGKILLEKLAGRDPTPGWHQLKTDLWAASGTVPVQIQAAFLLAVKRRGEAVWELAFGNSWEVPLDK